MSNAPEGNYSSAAVVSNTQPVSSVGRDILARGGSAVDAAIASLLCEGLTAMQNMGLGGGVLMNIYKRNVRRAYFMDAREVAPLKASRDMFRGNSAMSSSGGAAIAVPGELMGYWAAHKKFGVLPWPELFEPAISMCLNGIPVNARLAKSFAHSGMEEEILQSPTLRQVLAPNGRLPRAGESMTMPTLARTMMTIADDRMGAMALYNGSLTELFLRDLGAIGSVITRQDLSNYRVHWHEPITARLNGGYTLYTAPPPGSGAVVAMIIQLLEGQLQLNPPINLFNSLRVAEAFKYAYALRTDLGDPVFTDTSHVIQRFTDINYISNIASRLYHLNQTENYPEYYGAHYDPGSKGGTINIVVHAPNGDAVVATSTINTLFGSLLASPSTGIILNNEMDDFSSPNIVNSFGVTPSRANFIEGGKRPLSSAAPTIITAPNGNVRMALGSAGGTHITSAIAQPDTGITSSSRNLRRAVINLQPSTDGSRINYPVKLFMGAFFYYDQFYLNKVIINHMWLGMSIKQAVDLPRIHHQLLPMVLKYEYGVPKSIVDGLERAGHRTMQMSPHSSVTAVANTDGRITAIYDYRRGGSTSGF